MKLVVIHTAFTSVYNSTACAFFKMHARYTGQYNACLSFSEETETVIEHNQHPIPARVIKLEMIHSHPHYNIPSVVRRCEFEWPQTVIGCEMTVGDSAHDKIHKGYRLGLGDEQSIHVSTTYRQLLRLSWIVPKLKETRAEWDWNTIEW